MELGRFPIRLFGGPHGGRCATVILLPSYMILCDGYTLKTFCYTKLDELEYGYSTAESRVFSKTTIGREQFLEIALVQPKLDLQWDDKKLL